MATVVPDLLGNPHTDLKWWGSVQIQKPQRWRLVCSLMQYKRGTKDGYNWHPRKLQYFFFIIMGIHGSKAGDSTLSSQVNKKYNKLKNELKKIMHPSPVSPRKPLLSSNGERKGLLFWKDGSVAWQWPACWVNRCWNPQRIGSQYKAILGYLRSPLISSLMGPVDTWAPRYTDNLIYIHCGPSLHNALCSLGKERNEGPQSWRCKESVSTTVPHWVASLNHWGYSEGRCWGWYGPECSVQNLTKFKPRTGTQSH